MVSAYRIRKIPALDKSIAVKAIYTSLQLERTPFIQITKEDQQVLMKFVKLVFSRYYRRPGPFATALYRAFGISREDSAIVYRNMYMYTFDRAFVDKYQVKNPQIVYDVVAKELQVSNDSDTVRSVIALYNRKPNQPKQFEKAMRIKGFTNIDSMGLYRKIHKAAVAFVFETLNRKMH